MLLSSALVQYCIFLFQLDLGGTVFVIDVGAVHPNKTNGSKKLFRDIGSIWFSIELCVFWE